MRPPVQQRRARGAASGRAGAGGPAGGAEEHGALQRLSGALHVIVGHLQVLYILKIHHTLLYRKVSLIRSLRSKVACRHAVLTLEIKLRSSAVLAEQTIACLLDATAGCI